MVATYVASHLATHLQHVMARCSLPYNQVAKNFAICVARAFQLWRTRRVQFELCLYVVAFGLFLDRVCEVSLAPRVDFADFSAEIADKRANALDGCVAFLGSGAAA